MKRRGRGFLGTGLFYQNTRRQIFVALSFGLLSSFYIWFPTWQRFELERKAKECQTSDVKEDATNNPNKSEG